MSVNSENICDILDWDTAFFGIRIARLNPSRLTKPILQQALQWCQENKIECLYFLADSDCYETVHLAKQADFTIADIRMLFERDLADFTFEEHPEAIPGISIRYSQLSDLPHLKRLTSKLYHHSRFFYDPHFSTERAEALYETWIEKSCKEYADIVLVMENKGEPVGYITCHISNPYEGSIGLVGVHEKLRGVGAGQHLVFTALQQFAERGVKRVEVVTQCRNCQAQRLYQRCGFLTKSVRLWYHKWFNT